MNHKLPENTHCNLETHHCEAPGSTPDAGVPDQLPTPLADGEPCTAGTQCESTNCVDGVCCESTCEGLCQTCALSGQEGLCLPIPDGQDPDTECSSDAANAHTSCNGTCDGQDACTFPSSDTACGDPVCVDGDITAKECDGQGGCQDGTVKAAREAIVEYIEVFYNRKRKHSTLGCLSPADNETRHQQQEVAKAA